MGERGTEGDSEHTVKITANIPLPLYEGLKLIHDQFGASWDVLFTNSVRGELQCMEGDYLESETRPLREKLTKQIRECLKRED